MSQFDKSFNWYIQFWRSGGVALVGGYGYIDVNLWSDDAQFYGYLRLAGLMTGAAWGGGVADLNQSPWMKVSPLYSICANDLHNTSGSSSITCYNDSIDGTLGSWKSDGWLLQGEAFSAAMPKITLYGANCTISGTWTLKESWGFTN